jgi:serine protease
MRKLSFVATGCAVLALFATPLAVAVPTPQFDVELNPAHRASIRADAEAARVIVKFRADAPLVVKHALSKKASPAETVAATTARAEALGQRLALALRAGRALDERAQVVLGAGMSSAELAARLAAEDDIEYAVPDVRRTRLTVPNDPYYLQGPAIVGASGGPASGQWYLHPPAGEVAASINAPGAWDVTIGDPSIVVAVLDTGVRADHPDLAGRLLAGYDTIHDVDAANDGDARDGDAADPGDWITTGEAASTSGPFSQCDVGNSSWHGTMTTSLIGAASNDGVGMAGVAWHVRMLPVRVLGKCGGLDSDIIAAMRWAAGLSVPGLPTNFNPARVLNLSLGSPGGCQQSYMDAISAITTKANPAVIVAAAGNSSGHEVGSPANCPGIIAVAAVRHVGTKVGFSDLGPQIAISAPGGNCVNTGSGQACLYPILAATNTGTTTPGASSYTSSVRPSVGTSFSSPLVAGVAALMLSANPGLTPAQVKVAMQATARPFPTAATSSAIDASIPVCTVPNGFDQLQCVCTTGTCGAGMLDAAAAVRSVALARPLVIEFYNAGLDTYFITANVAEAASIDNGGSGPGWVRTGQTFNAGGAAQVCRFYGSVTPGPNSHFYTIDTNECSRLKQLQALVVPTDKRWNFESLDFASTAAVNGGCATGLNAVYRAYNNGFARGIDSNHRITTSQAAIAEVVARGWISEGVVMCAP